MTSLVYRNQTLYELLMLLLYRQHYASRYRAIAELIPAGVAVLDVCCGPAVLYTRFLKNKSVSYTGLDFNEGFVRAAKAKGIAIIRGDAAMIPELPEVDFVVMQASLYHFLPDHVTPMIEKMLKAAKQKVIIAEPVRNLSSLRLGLVARLIQCQTDAGSGPAAQRFDEVSLAAAIIPFAPMVECFFPIAGGREIIYVLRS
jgi:SAM-dependent methyltransferase